jgi:xyloglucan-specific exo-beta-1,4-glucanase
MRLRLAYFLPALCLLAHCASAAELAYVWRNVRVGGGGYSPALVFSTAERDLAYLRTDIGGLYRIDRRSTAWIPLQDAFSQSNLFGIESVAPDPHDANVVYVAAGMYRRESAAILRSHDRGATWDIVPVTFRMGGNEDGRGLGERLAIDPNATQILYFGSRHDGLQRSTDSGRTWSRVDSFPYRGRGVPPAIGPTNAGLSFVVFNPAGGPRGTPTRTLFVGVADRDDARIYRSDDAGATWQSLPASPRAELLPGQAQLDSHGILYVTYVSAMGPNGIVDGAVLRFDTRTNTWRDISPDKSTDHPPGGYLGLSLDRQHAGTLLVATVNRWVPGDTIWRTRDDGDHWSSIADASDRDVTATPFLTWGDTHAEFGHWMSGVAIDPFDSSHAAYTTGATLHATHALERIDRGQRAVWKPWVEGVEETAIITLTSPPLGPPLLSGFGDIAGFVHERLDRSPTAMFVHPSFTNTVFLDYAGRAPNIVVRGGRARLPRDASRDTAITLAWSDDFGRHWSPIILPPQRSGLRADLDGTTAITVSADGTHILAMTREPMHTHDRGQSWTPIKGLPAGARAIADRVDTHRFYALDFDAERLLTSRDGGAEFVGLQATGLPAPLQEDRSTNPEHPSRLLATPGLAGHLWFVSRSGLFRSTNGGAQFTRVATDIEVEVLTFGRAPPERRHPALFAIGRRGELRAIWRSDDEGVTWLRVNDDAHEYGRRYRVIAGDPRVFGRVYVGTDGRGIVYGEPRAH